MIAVDSSFVPWLPFVAVCILLGLKAGQATLGFALEALGFLG
jgi:hypothetical protein